MLGLRNQEVTVPFTHLHTTFDLDSVVALVRCYCLAGSLVFIDFSPKLSLSIFVSVKPVHDLALSFVSSHHHTRHACAAIPLRFCILGSFGWRVDSLNRIPINAFQPTHTTHFTFLSDAFGNCTPQSPGHLHSFNGTTGPLLPGLHSPTTVLSPSLPVGVGGKAIVLASPVIGPSSLFRTSPSLLPPPHLDIPRRLRPRRTLQRLIRLAPAQTPRGAGPAAVSRGEDLREEALDGRADHREAGADDGGAGFDRGPHGALEGAEGGIVGLGGDIEGGEAEDARRENEDP
jgi:hypothetical protein